MTTVSNSDDSISMQEPGEPHCIGLEAVLKKLLGTDVTDPDPTMSSDPSSMRCDKQIETNS
jgi:hypothetical protein